MNASRISRIMIVVLIGAILIAAVIIGSQFGTAQRANDTELTLTSMKSINSTLEAGLTATP